MIFRLKQMRLNETRSDKVKATEMHSQTLMVNMFKRSFLYVQ